MRDKSEEKRFELSQKIIRIEQEEEDFSYAVRQYRQKLENFEAAFYALTTNLRDFYRYCDSPQQSMLIQEMDELDQLQRQVDQYGESEEDRLTIVSRRVCQNLDDHRERLIKERNQLPWE